MVCAGCSHDRRGELLSEGTEVSTDGTGTVTTINVRCELKYKRTYIALYPMRELCSVGSQKFGGQSSVQLLFWYLKYTIVWADRQHYGPVR